MRVLPTDVRGVREGDGAVPGLREEMVLHIHWLTPVCVWRGREGDGEVGGEQFSRQFSRNMVDTHTHLSLNSSCGTGVEGSPPALFTVMVIGFSSLRRWSGIRGPSRDTPTSNPRRIEQ